MSEVSNLDVLRQHLAAGAAHDATAAGATYADDGYYALVPLGLRFEGRDMVEFQYAASYDTISDMTATYQWEHAEGDTVVQCGRITGVAGDQMLGVPSKHGQLDFPFTAGHHLPRRQDDRRAVLRPRRVLRTGGPRCCRRPGGRDRCSSQTLPGDVTRGPT